MKFWSIQYITNKVHYQEEVKMTPEYINTHESIYNYLFSHFLPELSDPYFRQDAAREIGQDERMTYCRYMAAWLPHEPHYDQILARCGYLDTNSITCLYAGDAVCLYSELSSFFTNL